MIASRLDTVQSRIAAAAAASGREAEDIRLIAASKGQSSHSLRRVAALGLRDFGENYVVEAVAKIEALAELRLCWHFIGTVQSNKIRLLAAHFDWVHSLTSLAHARRLNSACDERREPLNVCLQLHPGGDRSGLSAAQAEALAEQLETLPQLRLRGLMILPRRGSEGSDLVQAAQSFFSLRRRWPQLDTLSMGMSADLEAAIAAGANCLRVGTALFGPRPRG